MKRILSFALSIAIVFSVFSCLSTISMADTKAATTSQLNMVARANYMYDSTWVCQRTVSGWGGTFYAGETYRIPYGQPINGGKYIGFGDVTVDTYLQAAADANSIFYTGRSVSPSGKEAPYYATDCSAFVSYCWDIPRKTTYSLPQVSDNLGYATASNNYNLQIGDALNSNSAGHVILVTGLSYDGNGRITQIEITEQTPPQLKRSYYTPESLGSKYGGKYTIQRYYGEVGPAPNSGSSPFGQSDEVTGRTGSLYVRGWALDTDNIFQHLEVHVYIGGPAGSGEGHILRADKERQDVQDAYGLGDYHGYEDVIGTGLSGFQQVYVYAIDNDGRNGSTLLSETTVYITPDTEKPVVGDVTLIASDDTGYIVGVNVSDNGYISEVKFPTWTEENPDNKIWYTSGVVDGVSFCKIPIADFNNYNGIYHTHAYVYDTGGNVEAKGNFSTSFHNPDGCVDNIIDEGGAIRVNGWAFDGDAVDEAAEVHVYIGGGPGVGEGHVIIADKPRAELDGIFGCGPNHGFDDVIVTSKSGEQTVDVYVINKGNGGNKHLGTKTVYISPDGEAPQISDAVITPLEDGTGYNVKCNVSDNRGIGSVKFPTWTEENPDNKIWYEGTVTDGVASVDVKFADFGDYQGTYHTHIYAYDLQGTSSAIPTLTTYHQPDGCFDLALDSQGAITVRGWAYDKDAPDENVEVHMYIGGPAGGEEPFEFAKITADKYREDLDMLFGWKTHGFEDVIETDLRGEQTIYMYIVNKGNGSNKFIGTQTVTITDKPAPAIGDIDLDGEVTITDATLLQKYLAEIETLTDEQLSVADANADGHVDIKDATYIQLKIACIV